METGKWDRVSLLLPDSWFRINIVELPTLPERHDEALHAIALGAEAHDADSAGIAAHELGSARQGTGRAEAAGHQRAGEDARGHRADLRRRRNRDRAHRAGRPEHLERHHRPREQPRRTTGSSCTSATPTSRPRSSADRSRCSSARATCAATGRCSRRSAFRRATCATTLQTAAFERCYVAGNGAAAEVQQALATEFGAPVVPVALKRLRRPGAVRNHGAGGGADRLHGSVHRLKPLHLNLAVTAVPRLPPRLCRGRGLVAADRVPGVQQLRHLAALPHRDEEHARRNRAHRAPDRDRTSAPGNDRTAQIGVDRPGRACRRNRRSSTSSWPSAPSPGASCSTDLEHVLPSDVRITTSIPPSPTTGSVQLDAPVRTRNPQTGCSTRSAVPAGRSPLRQPVPEHRSAVGPRLPLHRHRRLQAVDPASDGEA